MSSEALFNVTPFRMTASMSANASLSPVLSLQDVSIGFDKGNVLDGAVFFRGSDGNQGAGRGERFGKNADSEAGRRPDPTGLGQRCACWGTILICMSEKELLAFRRNIGFVFQEGALFDSLTVADNVAYCLREEHVDEDEIEPRVRESLRFVEMEDTLEKLPSELSGGMRRRVSIARALVSRPHVVLYDSPTAGLDPVTSQTIITLILRLRDTQGRHIGAGDAPAAGRLRTGELRFDGSSGRVVHVRSNGASHLRARPRTLWCCARESVFRG